MICRTVTNIYLFGTTEKIEVTVRLILGVLETTATQNNTKQNLNWSLKEYAVKRRRRDAKILSTKKRKRKLIKVFIDLKLASEQKVTISSADSSNGRWKKMDKNKNKV